MNVFDDIRPYNDDEVKCVLKRLLHNNELIGALTYFNFPVFSQSRLLRLLMRYVMRNILSYKFKNVNSIRELQLLIEPYMAKMIGRTTTKVTWSGLSHLSKDTSYLFLSNHRDIALDPALVNYGLHRDGRDTARIAIGDNLLSKPYISDLMRLNKSFIVKRSIVNRREKITTLQTLSSYISHSVKTGHSVWIAHREGRAKDGNDFTDPAIIKMLQFNYRNKDLKQMLQSLNIVPVSISYELNPCDFMKAQELYLRNKTGEYIKTEEEDLNNIISGIQGQKGRVHVAFGDCINTDITNVGDCAKAIDKQIHSNYKLYPANYAAYDCLHTLGNTDYFVKHAWKNVVSEKQLHSAKQLLNERLSYCKKEAHSWLLKIYANPVKNKLIATDESNC